ncbi:uncharacterized protein LOC130700790 isoform X1 [Daphnia carinata]|uniref:uncharacterized protein LOC130700790 isoform X1 n=1 Tax=Daphnia carinata TaxID=120202 RepID=UPI002580DBF2|nr:uncharacterized protein LOC130700790 isoform X1 [Daphnia carinata]
MNKVIITLALLIAVTVAVPQGRRFGGNTFGRPVVGLRPIGGGLGGLNLFGGSGTGAGAGTGSAGFGGVSASGVGISSAQNGGFGTGSGSGSAGSNFFTGQNFATGTGSGQSAGK